MSSKTEEPNGKAKGISRRGIFGRIGATGLMASAALFAGTTLTAKPAAAGPLCCNLANDPPNIDYDDCYDIASYIWYCDHNGYLHCACCETEGNRQSAARCQYG